MYYILFQFMVLMNGGPTAPMLVPHASFKSYEECEARIVKYARERPYMSLEFGNDSVTLVEIAQQMSQGYLCVKIDR